MVVQVSGEVGGDAGGEVGGEGMSQSGGDGEVAGGEGVDLDDLGMVGEAKPGHKMHTSMAPRRDVLACNAMLSLLQDVFNPALAEMLDHPRS